MKQPSRSARYLAVLLALLAHGFTVGFGPPRLAARDFDPAPLWPAQARQLGRMAPPEVGSAAALLMDAASQTVLYQKDAARRWAPASTTKMVTALVALERSDLNSTVVVQPEDLAVASAVGLTAGETWRLEDLIYALLLSSDNAAGLAIARHVAGSVAGFVDLMNAQAARWGLEDTHFANPHGLDDPQQYSTAADLAQIALHGLAQPTFARIVATRERQAEGRTLRNLNELLGSYPGAEGVKTGTTDQAGQCLVSTVRRPDGWAVCVVLGSGDRYRDSRLLLDYYFGSYCSLPLRLGPVGLNRMAGPDGSQAALVLQEERRVLLPRWQLPWLRVHRLCPGLPPGGSGGPVGTARFALGDAVVAELPLYAAAP